MSTINIVDRESIVLDMIGKSLAMVANGFDAGLGQQVMKDTCCRAHVSLYVFCVHARWPLWL